jgi:rubrerythrin
MLLTRFLNPFVWRKSRAPGKLYSFSCAEQGSVIDMMQAAQLTPSTKRAALYIRHANDEARHANLFANRSTLLQRERGKVPFGAPRADTEGLFLRLGEKAFLAFVHLGERHGCQQFEEYIRYFEATDDSAHLALFTGVVADERRHCSYTHELLVELAGSELLAKRAIAKAQRWRAWQAWRRVGRNLAGRLHFALMLVLYLAVSPLSLVLRASAPRLKGWRS